MKRQKMESVLDQLKHHTTVVADTGDFNGESRRGGRGHGSASSPRAAQSGGARPQRRAPAGSEPPATAGGESPGPVLRKAPVPEAAGRGEGALGRSGAAGPLPGCCLVPAAPPEIAGSRPR